MISTNSSLFIFDNRARGNSNKSDKFLTIVAVGKVLGECVMLVSKDAPGVARAIQLYNVNKAETADPP